MTSLMINFLLIATAIVTNGFETAEETTDVVGGKVIAYASGEGYAEKRAAEFLGSDNANYLAVKTEGNPFTLEANTNLVETLYLDTLATFIPCGEPSVGGDKIVLWVGTDGYLYVKGGYYEAGLGLGGVSAKTYKTGYKYGTAADKWVRVVVKMYKPFEKVNSYAFKVFVDGNAIALDNAEVVAPLVKSQFDEQISDAARNEYAFGYLIPSLDVTSTAQTLKSFVAQGSDAAIDDVVITDVKPNNEVAGTGRYFLLANEVGLASYQYKVGDGELKSFAPSGYAAVNAIKLDTTNQVEVTISNVQYTDGSSFGLDKAKNCEFGIVDNVATITNLANCIASATLTISGGAKPCKLTVNTTAGATTEECDSVAAAVYKLQGLEYTNATIRLTKGTVAEYVELANVTNVTFDLSGRTLCGPGDDCQPILKVKNSENVTIKDSMGVGKVKNDVIEYEGDDPQIGASMDIVNSSVTITGGSFLGEVKETSGGTAKYSLQGGKYYANGTEAEGFDLSHRLASGYTNVWYEAGYWRVMKQGIAPVTPTSVAAPVALTAYQKTVNLLGVSALQADTLTEDEFEIELGNVSSEVVNGSRVFSCVATVTNGGVPVIMNESSLNDAENGFASCVEYSTDLVHWDNPDTKDLTVEPTGVTGEYKLSFTLGNDQNYFVRIKRDVE